MKTRAEAKTKSITKKLHIKTSSNDHTLKRQAIIA
ncbi:hypothetical protein M513_00402 [Trichuris suis]|uniref:Uncharacterized protein n=1 Tax=Trichuris suis TaxID=68888 RepID=A0A085MNB3_9BILA|nr:hypothetical protein M513_00402 [Trichuris suis]